MTLDELTTKLPPTIDLPTLGGHASFLVVNVGGTVHIINSGGTHHQITQGDINAVYARYSELQELEPPEHLMAGRYVHPNWDNPVPNNIIAPYIAKIIDHFISQPAD